jgi:AcrR family transcriptional regulator
MQAVMRKKPRQERAQSLVSAVKESCRQILFGEMEGPLSTTELANRAGVSVGSLYQYFPNIEAVVASVYEDLALEQTRSQRDYAVYELSEMPLEQGLNYIVSSSVNFHRQMLELNPVFHRKYHEYSDLNECFNRMADDGRSTIWILTRLIEKGDSSIAEQDIHLMASLVIELIGTAINAAIKESPVTLFDPVFESRLLTMCLGLLNPAKT